MNNKRSNKPRNTKFVRIDNSTWIETDALVPDDVARMQFLQKVQLSRPGSFESQVKDNLFYLRT
ncbi:MAG TPA: hypothetical protein PLS58_05130 [Bacteroidales bacterium]|nr:hypothetical protein [Bacteroidales bacterium]